MGSHPVQNSRQTISSHSICSNPFIYPSNRGIKSQLADKSPSPTITNTCSFSCSKIAFRSIKYEVNRALPTQPINCQTTPFFHDATTHVLSIPGGNEVMANWLLELCHGSSQIVQCHAATLIIRLNSHWDANGTIGGWVHAFWSIPIEIVWHSICMNGLR